MKNLNKIAVGILIALLLILVMCSCSDNRTVEEVIVENELKSKTTFGGFFYDPNSVPNKKEYHVAIIDSCQYIVSYRRMTHKGNCNNPQHNK